MHISRGLKLACDGIGRHFIGLGIQRQTVVWGMRDRRCAWICAEIDLEGLYYKGRCDDASRQL